jgi:hypothetical protein
MFIQGIQLGYQYSFLAFNGCAHFATHLVNNTITTSTWLIETTLLEEEDAKLEFSGIKTPQKNSYLKLANG